MVTQRTSKWIDEQCHLTRARSLQSPSPRRAREPARRAALSWARSQRRAQSTSSGRPRMLNLDGAPVRRQRKRAPGRDDWVTEGKRGGKEGEETHEAGRGGQEDLLIGLGVAHEGGPICRPLRHQHLHHAPAQPRRLVPAVGSEQVRDGPSSPLHLNTNPAYFLSLPEVREGGPRGCRCA